MIVGYNKGNNASIFDACCDLRLGDSRLQYSGKINTADNGCDLRLGDSRLQYRTPRFQIQCGCDLRLGDSRLQSFSKK